MVAHAVEPSPTDDAGITVGVTGQQWRASVSAWGAVTPWAEERLAPLDWAVAADDRWHLPSKEAAVRQRRFDGTLENVQLHLDDSSVHLGSPGLGKAAPAPGRDGSLMHAAARRVKPFVFAAAGPCAGHARCGIVPRFGFGGRMTGW